MKHIVIALLCLSFIQCQTRQKKGSEADKNPSSEQKISQSSNLETPQDQAQAIQDASQAVVNSPACTEAKADSANAPICNTAEELSKAPEELVKNITEIPQEDAKEVKDNVETHLDSQETSTYTTQQKNGIFLLALGGVLLIAGSAGAVHGFLTRNPPASNQEPDAKEAKEDLEKAKPKSTLTKAKKPKALATKGVLEHSGKIGVITALLGGTLMVTGAYYYKKDDKAKPLNLAGENDPILQYINRLGEIAAQIKFKNKRSN